MPGLIDAHVHIFLSEVNLTALEDVPLTLLAARGIASMRGMLMRGFTTLRDVSGADHGIKTATESGIVDAPRLFIAGKAISQTGGHADFRHKTQERVRVRLQFRRVLHRAPGRRRAGGDSCGA